MIETPALWVTIILLVPLMALASWWDLKHLKIPNWQTLAMFGVFVVTGLWGLDTETFLWRLGQGLIVLGIGYILFAVGVIGGGDAKMAAALAPFIVPVDVAQLLVFYALVSFVLLIVLRMVMQACRHKKTGWLSIDQLEKPARERVFPMGLIFGLTITGYLAIYALDALNGPVAG